MYVRNCSLEAKLGISPFAKQLVGGFNPSEWRWKRHMKRLYNEI